jgi:hypothetical protein
LSVRPPAATDPPLDAPPQAAAKAARNTAHATPNVGEHTERGLQGVHRVKTGVKTAITGEGLDIL